MRFAKYHTDTSIVFAVDESDYPPDLPEGMAFIEIDEPCEPGYARVVNGLVVAMSRSEVAIRNMVAAGTITQSQADTALAAI